MPKRQKNSKYVPNKSFRYLKAKTGRSERRNKKMHNYTLETSILLILSIEWVDGKWIGIGSEQHHQPMKPKGRHRILYH